MKRTLPLALLAGFVATGALAAPPAVFLRDAGMGDNSEIALGRLAEQRGGSPAAKEAGRVLQRDHGASKQAAMPILKRLHLSPPAGVKPEARAEMRKLERLKGAAFDREFARFSVAEHRKDIAKFEAQAKSGDRETAGFAKSQLPVLRHHLDMARALERGK